MIDNNTQMKEHSSSREGSRQKFWAAIRKPSRRMGLIAIMGFVLLAAGLLFFARYSPQRVMAKINREVPKILDEVNREIKFNLLPSTAVANAQAPTLEPDLPVTGQKATGPLRVNPQNPRYFTDGSGRSIYLTGSHTWSNLQDNGGGYPPPIFDYIAYLDFLQQNNHNYFRLWAWEQSRWTVETADNNYWFGPLPYQRIGPGYALDGQPKYDLTKFNQAYFDRLRARIIAAGDRGMYVSVMLFNGWSIEDPKGQFNLNNPWKGHPYNNKNNINGINGDPSGNGSGEEVHTMQVSAVTALQEAYIRKVIDTVNDLDNVLYEISNESNSDSLAWQGHMVEYIHQYEAGKPKQHPVGMTIVWPFGNNADLFASAAEWISPNSGDGTYLFDPPVTDGSKVIISDTDHLCGVCGNREWIWKSFTRGYNVIFMDVYDGTGYGVGADGFDPNDPTFVSNRKNMGYTLSYARRMNLTAMTPVPNMASTGFVLANPSGPKAEYLVYLPTGGDVTVDLSGTSGNLTVEWFNPENGSRGVYGTVVAGGNLTFTAPFNGDAVLYLYSTPDAETYYQLFLPLVLTKKPTTPQYLFGGTLNETFDGAPGNPEAWDPANWDVQVHSRDDDTWLTLESMQAAHSMSCDPPPATHHFDGSYPMAVFHCRNHVMTAIKATGYGVIYLTPNHLVDFSTGESVIRFDLSTLRTSDRDWVDFWITPYDQNLALPNDFEVDLAGAPRNSVHIRMDFSDTGYFTGEIYRNFIPTELPSATNKTYDQVLTPTATERSAFELRISRTHIKFGMPKYNLWWFDTNIADLGWDIGLLQLGHHSYSPEKDCGNSHLGCTANTWHWDNVSINPAIPFTMIKADRRYILKDDSINTINFDVPAPSNAYLRFSGIGTIEVSLNGGSYQKATKAQSSQLPGVGDYHPEHLSNYWMTVPKGTQTVAFRFKPDGWYHTGLPMIAKDFAIWSLVGD